MNDIRKHNALQRENLNDAAYFQSVLEEAYRLKRLSDSELSDIQAQTIRILTQQMERYTRGESSSVKVEMAQSLMSSIFYTIGFSLKSLPDPDLCVDILLTRALSDLFQEGNALIRSRIVCTRELLDLVKNACLHTDNMAYNDTLQKGLPLFFTAYDPEFAAHETPGAIDYPLATDDSDLTGIEYIHHYLKVLNCENRFCLCFSDDDIQGLLYGYDADFPDLLINIFERVLINALGVMIIRQRADDLRINHHDRIDLNNKLYGLPHEGLLHRLHETTVLLCDFYKISDMESGQDMMQHIYNLLPQIAVMLEDALTKNHLNTFFIEIKEEKRDKAIRFIDGESISDERFRSITEEIRQCHHSIDKVEIIKNEIHSIRDLVDTLDADCLFGSEYAETFQSLKEMELALLIKRLPLKDPARLREATELNMEDLREWQCHLLSYYRSLPNDKAVSVTRLARDIAISESQVHI